ncbi:urease accessory protein UreE [Lentisalinibacter sediminis]|uniref:urease accessory protein UreE n=1 Tax=Lentisalinibacter sediminis TaxID=2992237 RepID=UPI003866F936
MTLPRAQRVIADPPADADVVELDYDARHRRRIAMRTESGREFLLDLPKAVALADGDGLALSDGTSVRVRAKPERVIDVRAASPEQLLRIAWHLGNRHLPTQILGETIRIRYDHVILDMLAGLGADTRTTEAPFHPEGGAYAGHSHHD